MSKKALFLAGPLTGVSYSDALDWRKYVESKLPADVIAFSALRGKRHVTKECVLKDAYPEHLLSTPQGTITRDRYDVSRCDALFVNFLNSDEVSIGTIMEMAWADACAYRLSSPWKKGIFTIILLCDRSRHSSPGTWTGRYERPWMS